MQARSWIEGALVGGVAALVLSWGAQAAAQVKTQVAVPVTRTTTTAVTANTANRKLVAKPALAPTAAQLQVAPQLSVEPVNTSKAPVKTGASGSTITMKPGDQVILRKVASAPEVKPVTLAPRIKTTWASTLAVGVSDPEKGTVVREFQPFLSAEVSPLRWDPSVGSYSTTLVVGLDPLGADASGASAPLSPAIRFQLIGENVDQVVPQQIEISEAGTNGYQRLRVLTRSFGREVQIKAHSRFGDSSFKASVEPGPAFIQLGEPAERRIDGFGLGRTTLSVYRRAANGEPWGASLPLQVYLSIDPRGSVDHVSFAANADTAKTSLVSQGVGEAVVFEANKLSAHGIVVTFAFPWLKFLLGLLGAACAGGLRVVTTPPEKRRGWLALFIGCIASGITIDILAALGAPIAPDWLFSVIRSELAWFAIGLVAGYPGVAAIAWAGEKLFGFGKPASAGATA